MSVDSYDNLLHQHKSAPAMNVFEQKLHFSTQTLDSCCNLFLYFFPSHGRMTTNWKLSEPRLNVPPVERHVPRHTLAIGLHPFTADELSTTASDWNCVGALQ